MYRCVRLKSGLLLAALCLAAVALPFALWRRVPAQSVMAGSPVVYLTFDDGPSEATPELLQALDELGVKASFFVTAQNPDCYAYAVQAHEAGHLLCAHTASHDFAKIYASEAAFWQDIDEVND
ncbi:MAG: polysaccharide deacetylase family protein, partial [Oscillospiraceae bacterium]|nr:polysaccharide deacetylase family protein [Oscillospiraceae bacterium]